MKPYNVEIFDRQFNFRANALVDRNDFDYKYDALSPEKNTIKLPKDITVRITSQEGAPGDMSVCTSDYVRIADEETEYTGVVIKVEKDENYTYVTYTDVLHLFDHEVYVKVDDVQLTYVEDYLYSLLGQEFIATDDLSQKVYGLNIIKTSQTEGIFDYCYTENTYTIINLLKDYINPAFRDFIIATTAVVNIPNKTVDVTIGKVDETDKKDIEGDLPNITSGDYVIRQSNDNHNKLELIDTFDGNYDRYMFYLHASDYSFNQIDADRITPVINDVEEFNSSIITEEAFWRPYNEALKVIERYNESHDALTPGELNLLLSAFQEVFPAFLVYARNNYKDSWIAHEMWGEIASEAGDGKLSNNPKISGNSYTAYRYGWEDQEMLDWWLSTLVQRPWTIRNTQLHSPYEFSWESVSCRNSEDRRWLLTDHGHSFMGTFLYDIDGGSIGNAYPHLRIEIPVYFDIAAVYQDGWEDTDTGSRPIYRVATCWTLQSTINHRIGTAEIQAALNEYKQSPEYEEAYERYKEEKFDYLLQAYANKVFKASKYSNNIELTVKADDPMINPLTMPIGQVVNIIHEGVSYNSILTGREVKGGLVKLIFGTIRLELTKILNMKGV